MEVIAARLGVHRNQDRFIPSKKGGPGHSAGPPFFCALDGDARRFYAERGRSRTLSVNPTRRELPGSTPFNRGGKDQSEDGPQHVAATSATGWPLPAP
jgi:hypothetical protein